MTTQSEPNNEKNTEDNIRVIKKYPNRRVYDTHESKYIKIDDLRDMIVAGIPFKVIDTQSKEDVTRSVLLQIILEQESETNPLFTTDNLRNFIRYYGNQNSQFFSQYMNQSLSFFQQHFQQQQEQFTKSMQDAFNISNPMDMFSKYTQANAEMWQQMQDSFFQQFSANSDDKNGNNEK